VVKSLEEVLGMELYQLEIVDPQIVGALGAALFAQERCERQQRRKAT